MAVEETKEHTPPEIAQFWSETAIAEEQFGADTFCPDLNKIRYFIHYFAPSDTFRNSTPNC